MTSSKQNKWYSFFPNFLTLMNLVSGSVAIYFAFSNNLKIAFYFMLLGAIFDFFDGFTARLLKVSGELGKQLDSLSDMITFGLLPGVIVFSLQRSYLFDNVGGFSQFSFINWICLLSTILIPVFSSLRLGRFNIDTRQSSSFIGVPTPANAIFWGALAFHLTTTENLTWLNNPIIISVLVLVFSLLMVIELPLFSLKFKDYNLANNWVKYVFLILALLSILFFKTIGFSFAIIIYISISFIIYITGR